MVHGLKAMENSMYAIHTEFLKLIIRLNYQRWKYHPHATKYYNIISNAKNDNTYIIEIPPLQDMKEQIKSLKKIKVMIIEFLLILEKINLQLMLNICFKCWKHWEK